MLLFTVMSRMNGKEITCKKCDKSFYVSGSRMGRKYCSPTCAREDQFGFKQHSKPCVWCGSRFEIAHYLRKQDKYCSEDCKRAAFKEKQDERYARLKQLEVFRVCKGCESKFRHNAYFDKKYCSMECQAKHLSSVRREQGNPNFKDGRYTHRNFQNRKSKQSYKHLNETRRYRKAFLAKYGYLYCEQCGVNTNGTQRFEVHHIYFASMYPRHKELHNDRNLILICIECHQKFHAGKTYEKEFKRLEKERGLKKLFAVSRAVDYIAMRERLNAQKV